MASTSINLKPAERVVGSRLWWAGPLAMAAAAAVNVIIYLIASGLLGIALIIPPQEVGVAEVIISSLVGLLGATLVFAALARFVSRPISLFRVISAVALLISLAPPLLIPGVPPAARVALVVMHVVAAVVGVGVLIRAARAA